MLFFLNASEETVMKLAGVLVNGLDSSEGPECLWILKLNPVFLVYFQGERIEKAKDHESARKEPRRSVTSPSGLFLFSSSSSLRFYHRRTIYEKSSNYSGRGTEKIIGYATVEL